MPELPDPLTPIECDLRGFPYMQLDVLRLRDSDLASIPDAEIFRASVLSWCVAWHQVPAASLPDDDAALCRLLGYGRDIKAWAKMRAAGALRGYVKCSDGRLYHPVVAEKATDAWQKKTAQRNRTEAARLAREVAHLARLSQSGNPTVTGNVTDGNDGKLQRQSQSEDASVTEDVTDSKERRGEERRKKEVPPCGGSARASRLPDDWQPDLEARRFARESGLDPDVVAAKFRDHWKAKGGKDGTKVDWSATWRNWCRNEPVMRRGNGAARDEKTGRRAAFVLPLEPLA